MWNALHPIVLPALLASLAPIERKNTYLGLLTFAGLVLAMGLQPISGAISDRWISRFGRRRPLMVIGTIFDVVFLMILGWAGGMFWIFAGYVGLQISSNTAQGPLQGLLRDRVPAQHLGAASSIKVFLDLGSLIAASFIAGRLVNSGGQGTAWVFVMIVTLLLISAGTTIALADEEPTNLPVPDSRAKLASAHAVEEASRSTYWWLIAERAMFLLGIYGLQAFGQYYLQDALQVPDPARQTGNLLAIIGTGTLALVLTGGWLSDRFGPKPLLYAASGLAAAGLLLMPLFRDYQGLYAVGALLGAGMGLFLTTNWALANELAPPADAGRFLGLTNIATAGAAAVARLEGPLVDLLNALQPGAWMGYKAVFGLGAACILLSMVFLGRIK